MQGERSRWRLPVAVSILVGLLGTLAAAGLWLARAEAGRLPPRVEIAGVQVGGMTLAEARARISEAASAELRRPVLLEHPGGQFESSATELGATTDVELAIAEAQTSRGAFSRLGARLGFGGSVQVAVSFAADPERVEQVLDRVAEEVNRPAAPARIVPLGRDFMVIPATIGLRLERATAAELLSRIPDRIELPLRRVEPRISDADAEAALARSNELVTNPPTVAYREERFEPRRDLLRRALRFEPNRNTGTIDVKLDPTLLARPLRSTFARYEREGRDASFRIDGERAILVPARRGREVSPERVAEELVSAPASGEVRARFVTRRPRLTTAKAAGLGIRELVSEFTTAYPCCAPRVTNIKRGAGILDGTIIPAGARFSLNDALGERTRERGFVSAPQIYNGRLEDAVGGGVSQIATTTFNAAFFAGLELIAHTPHQFYISRYPMGREATVSWGGPELIFRNDWKAAILMKVEATDTSITVRFYSSKLGRRVETETGELYASTEARVIREPNPALEPGQELVTQDGGIAGFEIDYTRRVYRGKRLIRNERFHVQYDPEDTIVQYGPPAPPPGAETTIPAASQ